MNRKNSIITISTVLGTFACGSIIGASIFSTMTNKVNTRFIAHRGLSSKYMQNTADAFKAASRVDDIWGIETDIWKTSSTGNDHFICSHDANPFWTTNDLYSLNDTSFIKDWDNNKTRSIPMSHSEWNVPDANLTVPTFFHYLQICKAGNKHPVIEIKQPSKFGVVNGYTDEYFLDQTDVEEIVDIVKGEGILEQATFIAFDWQELEWAKNYVHTISTGETTQFQQLIQSDEKSRATNDGHDTNWFLEDGWDVSLAADILTYQIVNEAHQNNRQVGVWGSGYADYPTLWEVFRNMGVNYITSDWTPNYS